MEAMYANMSEKAAPALRNKGLAVLALAAAAMLAGCGGGSGEKASQTAVKVNREEITVHQINFMLQRMPGLKPEQAEAASRQVLERLIEQTVVVQKAEDMKLDREPRVVQQIEAAKREILARAYIERLGESVAKPSAEEIAKYYAENPALFKERRVYNLQEVTIEVPPEQVTDVRAKVAGAKSLPDFIEQLKGSGLRFQVNQAVRSAEQLPLANLEAIARMKDGETMFSQVSGGVQVLYLAGSRLQPVDEAAARPVIEQFLLNRARADRATKEIKALREAAKIEYVGKFAAAPASAPQAGAAPASAARPAAPAASGLDAGTISKGMGLGK
jgi:EpsD family peptidyl-prolyl cis-trans isomerase